MRWPFVQFGLRKPTYRQLDEEEPLDRIPGTTYTIDESPDQGAQNKIMSSRLPWVISTITLALCVAMLLFETDVLRSFETGFATDLRAAWPQITTEQVRFTGTPSFNKNGEIFVPEIPGELKYVGKPSQEIDENWSKILSEEPMFVLSEEEAYEAWGPEYKRFWNENRSGYTAGFDVFHTLHCLNHIRQAFYPDYYHPKEVHEYYGEVHNWHCIDHIRQSIQCQGDMTPIPSTYFPSIRQNYVITNQVHTCRKFEPILKYTDARVNGSLLSKLCLLADRDFAQTLANFFRHPVGGWSAGLSVDEEMSVTTQSSNVFNSAFEDPNLIINAGLTQLIDSQAQVHNAGKGNRAEEIAM